MYVLQASQIRLLQYPFLLIALYYCSEPIFLGIDTFSTYDLTTNYNLCLLFAGIGLSFTSLADITKRTKIGNKLFGKRKNAKLWLIYVGVLIITTFILAVDAKFFSNNQNFNEFAIGLFVFGIGMIGLLRMQLEIIKTYQTEWDKIK